MTAKVSEYWDRPWYRRGFVVVALAVLVAGLGVQISRSHGGAAPLVAVPQQNAFHPINAEKAYGHKIPLPHSVLVSARKFVKDAVLREHPGATWSMVEPRVRAGISRADWNAGNMPVPQFSRKYLAGVGLHVIRSRQREILLDMLVASKNQVALNNLETLIEYKPQPGGGWKISYVAPRGSQPPIPAAQ
ncbi:MAG TPA: hypothetical protein VFQ71_13825 [Gaiellales bacterium]|jgi:hypothetical protein|nr:hypothetical protein [Gaiellales bacterium]